MGESTKLPKSQTFETLILKLAVYPLNIQNFKLNGQLCLGRIQIRISMESQPQNPEFGNNPVNVQPCKCTVNEQN